MDRELALLLFLVASACALTFAVMGRHFLFAVLPLLVTLNGVAIPTPAGMVRVDQLDGILIALGLAASLAVRPRRLPIDRPMRWMLALFALNLISSIVASPDR